MKRFWLVPLASIVSLAFLAGADWPQFRGASGTSTSDERGLTQRWDDSTNLVWKAKLPGSGASSPVILGQKVFITCYSGYGTEGDAGNQRDLVRHLVCLDRKSGDELWKVDLRSDTPEARFQGFMTQHGYASNTPATDGERIYVFLGTAGVYAFDLEGKQLWKQSVGTGTDGWGSGSSVRLFENLVIVNAAVESGAVVALKKENGAEAWQFNVARKSWSTPVLVEAEGGRQELVVSSQGRISGVDPRSGKELWHCEGIQDYTCPSVTPGKGIAYVSGARQSTIIAVRAGGTGDVNASHVLWNKRIGANVSTPVLYKGHLFGGTDRGGIAYCVNAETGGTVYQQRLSADAVPARPAAFQEGGRKRGMRKGGGGGGGGPGGGVQFYASYVAADDKIFAVSRTSGTFVLAAKPAFEALARNQFESDGSPFDGTPAISDGQIFLRSNQNLYCVGTGK